MYNYGMSFYNKLIEPFLNLLILGRKALLALLGIVVGCSSVVALLNIGNNATEEVVKVFSEYGANLFLINIVGGGNTLDNYEKGVELVVNLKKEGVIQSASLVSTSSIEVGSGVHIPLVGVEEDIFSTLTIDADKGRVLQAYDKSSFFVVVGYALSDKYNFTLGSKIKFGGYYFDVLGVLPLQINNHFLPFDINNSAFIFIKNLKTINGSVVFTNIIGSVKKNKYSNEQKIESIVKEKFNEQEAGLVFPSQLLENMNAQTTLLTYLLAGIGAIALLVGGVGVMNVMLMSVSQRKKEIGIRRAVGARSKDIIVLFLSEAVVLSVIGSLLGCLLGIILAYVFAYYVGWAFVIAWFALPIAVITSLVLGILFGISPALSAARLQPIEALKDE